MNQPGDVASSTFTAGAHLVREPLSRTGVFTNGLSRTRCAPTGTSRVGVLCGRMLLRDRVNVPMEAP